MAGLIAFDDQCSARRMLEESIARYHAKESNYEMTRKIANVFPDSFYAHLICALHKVENRLIGPDKMAYYAYECLDQAKSMMEGAHASDFELLRQVEIILNYETESVLSHYDY